MGDILVDLVAFLRRITQQSGGDRDTYNNFIEFFNNSLIHKVKKEGTLITLTKSYQKFSGMGLFLPQNPKELDRYRYLEVFSDLKIAALLDKIIV